MARLQEHYKNVVRSSMREQFRYKNTMAIPYLRKIVLNSCVGNVTQDKKDFTLVTETFAAITGQKPVITKAKRSVAGFKLKKGMPIGVMVTLRGKRMYEFLDRLITIAMPRLRDFRGVSRRSFDGNGNFAIGFKEHVVFPEVNYDRLEKVFGMDIVIVTTARTNFEAESLLRGFGFPFKQESKESKVKNRE